MRSPFELKAPVPKAVPFDPIDRLRDAQVASSRVTMTANEPLAMILISRFMGHSPVLISSRGELTLLPRNLVRHGLIQARIGFHFDQFV